MTSSPLSPQQSPLLVESDKAFWHHYLPFYGEVLTGIDPGEPFDLMELGVFNSHSIRYWRSLYPRARLTGCDIISDSTWYRDSGIRYLQFDQADASAVASAIDGLDDPRILIDDGSHVPFHQLIFLHHACRACCRLPTDHRRVVIIEDVHTSLPFASQQRGWRVRLRRALRSRFPVAAPPVDPYARLAERFSPLGLLLSLQRVLAGSLTSAELAAEVFPQGPTQDYALYSEIVALALRASSIQPYRRSRLPDRCFCCGSRVFNPLTLCCSGCGQDGYGSADSMSIAISFNHA